MVRTYIKLLTDHKGMEFFEDIKKRMVELTPDIDMMPLEAIKGRILSAIQEVSRVNVGMIAETMLSFNSRRQQELLRRQRILREYSSRVKVPIVRPTPKNICSSSVTMETDLAKSDCLSLDLSVRNNNCVTERHTLPETEINNSDIQITVNHEHKTNFLRVTLHNAQFVPNSKDGQLIFVTVSITPGKLQKQTSKGIKLKKVNTWKQEFIFRKLTIGQLEDCSISVKIYQKNPVSLSSVLIGQTGVALKDINIKETSTTNLNLNKMKNLLLVNKNNKT